MALQSNDDALTASPRRALVLVLLFAVLAAAVVAGTQATVSGPVPATSTPAAPAPAPQVLPFDVADVSADALADKTAADAEPGRTGAGTAIPTGDELTGPCGDYCGTDALPAP